MVDQVPYAEFSPYSLSSEQRAEFMELLNNGPTPEEVMAWVSNYFDMPSCYAYLFPTYQNLGRIYAQAALNFCHHIVLFQLAENRFVSERLAEGFIAVASVFKDYFPPSDEISDDTAHHMSICTDIDSALDMSSPWEVYVETPMEYAAACVTFAIEDDEGIITETEANKVVITDTIKRLAHIIDPKMLAEMIAHTRLTDWEDQDFVADLLGV